MWDVLTVPGPALVMGMGACAIGSTPLRSRAVRPALQIAAGVALCPGLCIAIKVPSFREVLDAVESAVVEAQWCECQGIAVP